MISLFDNFFSLIESFYIDGGPGYCADGRGYGYELPCLYYAGTNYIECESACSKLEGCVAFDIHVNGNCNLHYASKSALNAVSQQGPYAKWEGGCGDNCQTNYGGSRSPDKGRCWVKRKGNISTFVVFLPIRIKLVRLLSKLNNY